LLFGTVGVFGGWRTAVVAVTVFAVVGAVKSLASLLGKSSANTNTASAPEENTASETAAMADPSTWTLGQEIPFGPSLAIGGFLYYAWPWLHLGVDRYLDLVR
jgi:prepilin signal peptidase PulO-like enzyme (type II secretory pathway)